MAAIEHNKRRHAHKVSKDNLFYYFKKLFFVPFLLLLLVSQECRGAGAIINHSQKAQKKNRVCWGCRASKSTSQKKVLRDR